MPLQGAIVANTNYYTGSFTAAGLDTSTATFTTSITDNESNTEDFIITAVASIIGDPVTPDAVVQVRAQGFGVESGIRTGSMELDATATSSETLTFTFSHPVVMDSIDTNWLNGDGQLHFDLPGGTVTVGAGDNGTQTWSLSSLSTYNVSDPDYSSLTGVRINAGESLTVRTESGQQITALIASMNIGIITTPQPVPEPSALAFLLAGTSAVTLRRKR